MVLSYLECDDCGPDGHADSDYDDKLVSAKLRKRILRYNI